MAWQFNPYAIPLFISMLAMFALTLAAWRHRIHPSAPFFLLFTLSITGYMIGYTLELLSASLPLILFWVKIEYVFSLSAPLLFLLFILSYNRYDAWLTRSRIVALFVVPAIQLLAVWTNEYHGLNWQTVGLETIGSVILFTRTYGPLFWFGTIYQYLIALIGTVVLLGTAIRSPKLQQRQLTPLIVSVIVVWAGSVLTIQRVSLLDLTPFSYAIVCCLIAWSLLRYKLFEIMPAAHGAIIKGMSDSVIVIDAQGHVIELNPAAERLLNQSATQVIGQPVASIFSQVPELIMCCPDDQETQREIMVRISGTNQHFDQRTSPLHDERGQLIGEVIVMRDITRLKQAEEAALRYATELEARNNELDAFSHTIAHDLKAPLTLIGGYAEIIRTRESEGLSPRGQSYIGSIHGAAIKMTEMVDELLRLARVSQVDGLVTQVDMNHVVRASLERFRAEIDQRGFQIDLMPDLPPALGQTLWLEEVFANLIGNAIKYAGKDNPTPCITIRGSQQAGLVRYEIQDNGLGIDLKDQTRLFHAFARFHTTEASGVGLGLTIVLRIVKRLNGQVGVESVLGKGSTFWFVLPVNVEKEYA
jgi:PAS domain S-box-containing protein